MLLFTAILRFQNLSRKSLLTWHSLCLSLFLENAQNMFCMEVRGLGGKKTLPLTKNTFLFIWLPRKKIFKSFYLTQAWQIHHVQYLPLACSHRCSVHQWPLTVCLWLLLDHSFSSYVFETWCAISCTVKFFIFQKCAHQSALLPTERLKQETGIDSTAVRQGPSRSAKDFLCFPNNYSFPHLNKHALCCVPNQTQG